MENILTIVDIGPQVSKSITVLSEISAIGSATYQIRYYDPIRAVRFFLGYAGFRDNLYYTPYRVQSDKEYTCRRYTNMLSGDQQQNIQETLNQELETASITIILLIVASDKTKLTLQSRDLQAYIVYLSISNLKAKAQHLNERPSLILLALLLCIKEGDAA